MLVWGDFVFIPFAFSVQNWFLYASNETLSPAGAAAIVAVFLIGFYIFRTCNMQKHQFKHNPEAKIWGRKPEGALAPGRGRRFARSVSLPPPPQ